jgi:hypothetical protein
VRSRCHPWETAVCLEFDGCHNIQHSEQGKGKAPSRRTNPRLLDDWSVNLPTLIEKLGLGMILISKNLILRLRQRQNAKLELSTKVPLSIRPPRPFSRCSIKAQFGQQPKKKPTKKAGLYRKKIKRNRQKVGEQMGEQ